MHKVSSDMYNNQNNHVNGKFEVEERRRKVASLLAQAMTEAEIASQLDVDQSVISRDIKAFNKNIILCEI
jgi:IS30 family transposase